MRVCVWARPVRRGPIFICLFVIRRLVGGEHSRGGGGVAPPHTRALAALSDYYPRVCWCLWSGSESHATLARIYFSETCGRAVACHATLVRLYMSFVYFRGVSSAGVRLGAAGLARPYI